MLAGVGGRGALRVERGRSIRLRLERRAAGDGPGAPGHTALVDSKALDANWGVRWGSVDGRLRQLPHAHRRRGGELLLLRVLLLSPQFSYGRI